MPTPDGIPEKSCSYRPIMAELLRQEPLTWQETWYELALPDGAVLGHQPGQFVEVSVLGVGEAPISVCSSPTRGGRRFELAVRAVGSVTRALARLEPGRARVGIRGPFGRPFAKEWLEGRDVLLIGGGCGVAPLRSLIQYVFDQREQFGRVTLLIGARTPADLLFRREAETDWRAPEHKAQVEITVDEGDAEWSGHVGVVTTLIPPLDLNPESTRAVVVGPPAMYQYVFQELQKKRLPEEHIILSLERLMKCGLGFCGHCAMGHLYCCTDGPVFRLSELAGIKEATPWH